MPLLNESIAEFIPMCYRKGKYAGVHTNVLEKRRVWLKLCYENVFKKSSRVPAVVLGQGQLMLGVRGQQWVVN